MGKSESNVGLRIWGPDPSGGALLSEFGGTRRALFVDWY